MDYFANFLSSFPVFVQHIVTYLPFPSFLSCTVILSYKFMGKKSVHVRCHFDKWLLYLLYFSIGDTSSCRPGLLLIVIMVWTNMVNFVPGYHACCTYLTPVTAINKATHLRTYPAPHPQPHTNIVYRSQTCYKLKKC